MVSTLDEVTCEWPGGQTGRGGEGTAAFEVGGVVGGRYRVRRVIGQGGMGSVLEVQRRADGRALALKYCRSAGAWGKRFAREVRLMARVRHPHVVPVVDAD